MASAADMACTAVLIDLDGTLVDTAHDIVEAANRMLDELGCGPLPFETISGKGAKSVVRLRFEAFGCAGQASKIKPVPLEKLAPRYR